jgi:hypothetical protein
MNVHDLHGGDRRTQSDGGISFESWGTGLLVWQMTRLEYQGAPVRSITRKSRVPFTFDEDSP